MIIEQIWTGNDHRNFNYLVACGETGEALAIDPCDPEKCLARARDLNWEITQILNTHEHRDHISGNAAMIQNTGAKLLAPGNASSRINGIDVGLTDDDVVTVGSSVEARVLNTPGHTMSHICLLLEAESPALFSGDAVFNAGVGNCRNGGDPETLYHTVMRLSELPETTRLYPGHDYLINNLSFTLSQEPENTHAIELLGKLTDSYDPSQPLVTTIGLEHQINVFLRLSSESVIDGLRQISPHLPASPSPKEVFLKLRELRNAW